MKKFTFSLYFLSLFSILIYSYSQIDLNLTLSANPLYQSFQQALIRLGYFNRPLSTLIFALIIIFLLIAYYLLLSLAQKGKLSTRETLTLTIFTCGILLFSYPAFSHDIFNYIFDARILVHHHQNPYAFTALDFPDDLWTRFMHWTHRTYPYGPTWLPITALFYLLGLGKFTLTLISFKLLGALSYLLSIYSLYQIILNLKSKFSILSLVLFAFNPLIIIESLVSPHLDITMAAFMLLALWLVVSKKVSLGWLSLLISIGIKYVSLALAPFILLFSLKKLSFMSLIFFSLIGSYFLTLVIVFQREILPWYFIVPFALTCLLPTRKISLSLMLGLTPALLFRYAPFLYFGDYGSLANLTRNVISLGIFVITLMCSGLILKKFFRLS